MGWKQGGWGTRIPESNFVTLFFIDSLPFKNVKKTPLPAHWIIAFEFNGLDWARKILFLCEIYSFTEFMRSDLTVPLSIPVFTHTVHTAHVKK
jgi:hypothetical protein